LFDFILDPRILRNIIIVLLRDSFYCLKTLHPNRFLNTFEKILII
jgi:hypothetical protein